MSSRLLFLLLLCVLSSDCISEDAATCHKHSSSGQVKPEESGWVQSTTMVAETWLVSKASSCPYLLPQYCNVGSPKAVSTSCTFTQQMQDQGLHAAYQVSSKQMVPLLSGVAAVVYHYALLHSDRPYSKVLPMTAMLIPTMLSLKLFASSLTFGSFKHCWLPT